MLTDSLRFKLRRVITVSSGKGGVLKTSITANVGSLLANGGYKTLVIDLDPQGNIGEDYGYSGTDVDDDGAALFNSVAFGEPLAPVKNVRKNLDVIPAGRRTAMLIDHLQGQTSRGNDTSFALAEPLAQIADRYDVVLIDTPPGESSIQTLALTAARWILIPTQADESSLKGLSILAERVVSVRNHNPDLAVLGAVLAPMNTSGTRIIAETRKAVGDILGGIAPVFATSIRYAQAPAVGARKRGQTVIELANDAKEQRPWYEAIRAAKDSPSGAPAQDRIADSANSLASDYFELTKEILTALGSNEQAAAAKGTDA